MERTFERVQQAVAEGADQLGNGGFEIIARRARCGAAIAPDNEVYADQFAFRKVRIEG